jgi:hypothetical protein
LSANRRSVVVWYAPTSKENQGQQSSLAEDEEVSEETKHYIYIYIYIYSILFILNILEEGDTTTIHNLRYSKLRGVSRS